MQMKINKGKTAYFPNFIEGRFSNFEERVDKKNCSKSESFNDHFYFIEV